MPAGVLAPSIKLDGVPLSAELSGDLIELRVDLTASAPAQATLRFTDWGGEHATGPRLKLGTAIEISIPVSDDQPGTTMVALPRLEVTEIGVDAPAAGIGELVVVAHDPSHRLGLGSSVRSHLQMSPNDVVRTLVQEHTPLSYRATGPSSFSSMKMPYYLRADSALAALNELVARAGAAWWVEDKTLVVGEPGSRAEVELTYLEDLRSCSVRVNGRYPKEVVVSGWDHATMKRIVGTAPTPKAVPGAIGSGNPFPQQALTVAGARASTTEEANQLAKVLAKRSADRRIDVRGVALSAPKLVPGGQVKISGFPSASGRYDVQQVEHVFRPGEVFETRFVAGSRDPLGMAGEPALGGQRASSIRFDGLVVGVVTDNKDPDKLGRVKVKFPWLSDQEQSDWARVTAFGGGSNRGSTFVPEVNDEVLVGFEGGDLRKAVVLGSLYNGKNKGPAYEVKGGMVQARTITSRLGHVFEMADGDGETDQHLLLKLADGKTRLRVGKDKVEVETPAGKPISLKSGQASITITDEGDITIDGNNVTIKAKANVKVEAQAEASTQGATAKVEAKGPVTVKGAMAELSSSGPTAVKGAVVQIN